MYKVKNKTLYLHIGLHKTGTSAIQSFLGLNLDIFKDMEFFVPTSSSYIMGDINIHHYIALAYKNDEKEIQKKNLKNIIKGSKKSKNIIISSEVFSESGLNPIQIFDNFSKIASNIKVIIYLRRQDNQIMSVYNQLVKDGYKEEFMMSNLPNYELDYFKFLNIWGNIVGKKNIIVCPYEQQQLYGGNIFSDFMYKALGMELINEFKLPKRALNARLSTSSLEYLRVVNKTNLDKILKRSLISSLQKYDKEKMVDSKIVFEEHTLLSPDERDKILNTFSESNKKIAYEYLKRDDGVLFEEAIKDYSNCQETWEGLIPRDVLDYAFPVINMMSFE
ncbi:MAG: hypothetical protein ACMUHX_11855, partial [bacterium]